MKTYNYLSYYKLLLCIYLIVPLSCENLKYKCSDSCCGENFEQSYTEIDSLKLTVGSIDIYQGNGYQRNDFSDSKSTSFNDAAINIEIHKLTHLIALQNSQKPDFNFSFLNQTYACSPAGPEPTQKLTSISISSDQAIVDDNVTYLIGEDISNFFSIVRYTAQDDYTIENFIIDQNNYPYLFGEYGSSMILKLNTDIRLPNQTITIQLNFDDNSSHSLTTNEFIIE